jgi:hypothetical protein
MNAVAVDQQVPIWLGDVDPASLDQLPMLRMKGRERSRATQNARQDADALGRKVMNDKQGSGQISRQGMDQANQRLDPSSRKSDYDDIVTGHLDLFPEDYDSMRVLVATGTG